MTALIPRKRNATADATAEAMGIAPRTVRTLHAQPRPEYEAEAAGRRRRAAELRLAGASYAAIAEEMETTRGAVGSLLHWARRHGELDQGSARTAV